MWSYTNRIKEMREVNRNKHTLMQVLGIGYHYTRGHHTREHS